MGKTPIAKPGYDKLFTRLAALEEMFPEQCLREPIAKLPAPRPTGLGCDFAENVYGALDVGLAETDRNLVVYRVDPSLDTRRSSCIK